MRAKKAEGRSRAIPFRINAENDAYVNRIMRLREYNNRNQTLNTLLSEHRNLFEVYRGRMKAKAQKIMDDWGLRPADFME